MNQSAALFLAATLALNPGPASAEMQCAPSDVAPVLSEDDPNFAAEVTAWSKVTDSRYLEGTDECQPIEIPGYEDYPTMRCRYSSVDDGASHFEPLAAEVVLLNPSARQLASWSVEACRPESATASSATCLYELRKWIVEQNGAQFPVAGSVVESECNSSRKYGSCEGIADDHPSRQPRNTWFRDGVSIDYKDAQGVKWSTVEYPSAVFDAIFDTVASDAYLNMTYDLARVAGARRENWEAWRLHIDEPILPAGVEGDFKGSAWRAISASVHKAACAAGWNELFNAVVYSNPSWTKS